MKTKMLFTWRPVSLISLSALIGLAGCMSLGREETIQHTYVLGGSPRGESEAAQDSAGLTIGVRRLQLAAYLERPFILVRRGPNQIGFSEFQLWGETLSGGINRAVAGYLGAAASVRAIDVAPWPTGERYDYVIQLHVLRFEGLAPEDPAAVEGEAVVLATWEIIRQLDGAVLRRGTTDYRESGWKLGDYAGLVTLLDAGLHVLTDQLVSSLDDLDVAVTLTDPAASGPAMPRKK